MHEAGDLPSGHTSASSVYSKIYKNVLPLLCLVAALCYIDRTNLAFASFSMTRDLQFSPSVYGTGSGLFFAGYSLAMIPSQLIGLRVGVSRWLGIQVAVWGLVAASFSTITSVGHFYALRFALGMAEAGAFPAIWYYLYLMLPKDALTFPFSALEATVSTANVLSAPLAAALLLLDGRGGLAGWQWLFLCEGLVTLLAGAAAGMLLPSGLQQASFVNGSERLWIQKQQGRTWQSQAKDDADVFSDWRIIREAFSNWRVWYVSAMGILKNIAGNAMLFWLPIIVASLVSGGQQQAGSFPDDSPASPAPSNSSGSGAARTLRAAGFPASPLLNSTQHSGAHGHAAPPGITLPVLLTSIPFLCTALFALWLGRSSQARGERAMHLMLPYLTAGALFLASAWLRASSVVAAFAALSVAMACTMGSNCVKNSYIPAVASPTSVSVAMALYNSVSNLGGILGPWLIGVVVEHTGSYDSAMQVLGLIMFLAAAMAWGTRGWEAGRPGLVPSKSPGKEAVLLNGRSVGSEMQSLMSSRS